MAKVANVSLEWSPVTAFWQIIRSTLYIYKSDLTRKTVTNISFN